MRSLTKLALAVGAAFAGWIAWGIAVTRSAEAVPYAHLRTVDGVELRRYPETVRVETTAPTQRTAFRRLFRYISGANADSSSLSMTTPVESRRGTSIPMTAPVRSEAAVRRGEAGRARESGPTEPAAGADGRDATGEPSAGDEAVRMAFYLPPEYDREAAPQPTDSTVSLVVEPPKTVAAKRFSWYAPPWRVARLERRLLRTIEGAGIEPIGEPFLLRYNDPMTPPFMRRNEVAVEVEPGEL